MQAAKLLLELFVRARSHVSTRRGGEVISSRRRLRRQSGFRRGLFESAALIGDRQRLHQPFQPLLRRPLPERPLAQFLRLLPTAKFWRCLQFVRAHGHFLSSYSSARRLASTGALALKPNLNSVSTAFDACSGARSTTRSMSAVSRSTPCSSTARPPTSA